MYSGAFPTIEFQVAPERTPQVTHHALKEHGGQLEAITVCFRAVPGNTFWGRKSAVSARDFRGGWLFFPIAGHTGGRLPDPVAQVIEKRIE